MGQISSDLLKEVFATWQHASLSTNATFYDSFGQARAEIKIEKLTYVTPFLFSPFHIFLLQWLAFQWACFQFENFWESILETGKFSMD